MILFLTRQIPHPPDIGLRIRQRQLLEAYAAVAPVQLVFGYEHERELEGVRALEPLCAGIHPVQIDWRGKPRAVGRAHWRYELRTGRRLRSFRSALFFSRAMQRTVEDLAPACRLVHVDDLHLAGHVEALRRMRPHGPRLVLDLDDVETRLRRDGLRVAPPAGPRARIAEGVDLALLALDQWRALRRFDRVLVASEPDRQALGGGPRLRLIPNGTTVPPRTLPSEASEPATILCLGTYGYGPNVDGLFAFLEGAWPQVRRAIPGARLLVVGRDMPERVRRLGADPAIEVHPDVPDVTPFYRRAAISVVPLRVGGGTRLKILEAFALGRAVVSTNVGCEGLEVEPGVHLLVADAPRAFADACIDLLRRPARRARLVAPARRRVEERYAWDCVHTRLTALATALLAEAEPASARARPSPAAPAGGRP